MANFSVVWRMSFLIHPCMFYTLIFIIIPRLMHSVEGDISLPLSLESVLTYRLMST